MHKSQVILLGGATVATVFIVGLYFYLRKKKREYDDKGHLSDKDELEFADLNTNEESVASAGQSIVKVQVPQHVVGFIIGKDGNSIKQLRSEFGVRFNFDRDEIQEKQLGNETKRCDRTLEIRGQREKVRNAERRIHAIIAEVPKYIETEILVPQEACGRIIGKGGQNIRESCQISGAKIVVDREDTSSLLKQRKILLSGTTVQVDYAKLLIKEKVEQVKADTYKYGSKDPEFRSDKFPTVSLRNTKEYSQVFVSAYDTPSHFYVQLISKESTRLDQLTNDLTEAYGTLDPEAERLESGKVGDLCVAPFENEDQWYRATISKIKQDRTVELYYIDFGDTRCMDLDELKFIRPQYKNLYAQAIQCYLPIQPVGGAWTDEACEEFGNLTHCSQWKPLMAKILYHKTVDDDGEVPVLQLIDTSQEEDIDVAATMIQKGHAVEITKEKYEVTAQSEINSKTVLDEKASMQMKSNQA